MNIEQRIKALVWLENEDFTQIGIDPDTISSELFQLIAEKLAEDLNENFTHKLADAISYAKEIQKE